MTVDPTSPPAPADRTPGLDIAALIFAIVVPPVGLVLALVARSNARGQGRRLSGVLTGALIVSIVLTGVGLLIAVVFVVLAILGFGLFAWTLQTISTGPTHPPSVANEVVLTVASDATSPLTDDAITATMRLIEARLDRADIDHDDVYAASGTLRVTLPDTAEPAEVVRAGEVVAGDYRVDLRAVLDATTCPSPAPDLGTGASEPSSTLTVCDNDGVEFTLAPVEITGTWISDAYATELATTGGTTSTWAVTVILNAEGTAALTHLTSRLIDLGPTMGRFAIVIDDVVLTVPVVNAVITNGEAQIAGAFDQRTAELLATELRLAAAGLSVQVESVTLID